MEEAWGSARIISSEFSYPWESVSPPETVFRALWDDSNFYFLFVAKDDDIVIAPDESSETALDNEDRVELFFASDDIERLVQAPDSEDPTYYSIEIDPLGRVHDYAVRYYRKFDSDWDMADLKVSSDIRDGTYVVEGKIALKSLESLMLFQGPAARIRIGIFRAELSHDSEQLQESWISWISPMSEQPDFHIPSAFGRLKFVAR